MLSNPLSWQSRTSCWYLVYSSTSLVLPEWCSFHMMTAWGGLVSELWTAPPLASGVSSRGQPPVTISGLTAGDFVRLGLGRLVSDPLLRRWWCSAVALLRLEVSFSSLVPGCLQALPTPCHGAIYISPWVIAILYPDRMCAKVPLSPHSLHSGSSLIPHLVYAPWAASSKDLALLPYWLCR